MTLKLKELTDEHLIGQSPCLGEVRMRRNAVRQIDFEKKE